jgi:hypothetical protein
VGCRASRAWLFYAMRQPRRRRAPSGRVLPPGSCPAGRLRRLGWCGSADYVPDRPSPPAAFERDIALLGPTGSCLPPAAAACCPRHASARRSLRATTQDLVSVEMVNRRDGTDRRHP